MGSHIHLLHHGHLAGSWKSWLAEIGIFVLAVLGLYFAISVSIHDIRAGFMTLGWFLGPAAIYFFGYSWCLPDVLGPAPREHQTLRQRWTDFGLLSSFIAALVILFAYAWAIWENYSYVKLARALPLILASCWLLAGCIVASDQYLSLTFPPLEIEAKSGWRARVRGAMRKWGTWLVSLLGVRRALAIGGSLVLLSLVLDVGDRWFEDNEGYRVLLGKEAWPLAIASGVHMIDLAFAHALRWIYALGLLIAVVALMAAALARIDRILRRSRAPMLVSGLILLLQLTSITFRVPGVRELFAERFNYLFFVAMLFWILPPFLWLRHTPLGGDRDHTRLAIMVLYLPIVLMAFAWMVFFAYFSLGLGAFVVGMLLVWWGFIQPRHGLTQSTANPQ